MEKNKRSKYIYIFCNENYGYEYLKSLLEIASVKNEVSVKVIISGKYLNLRNRALNSLLPCLSRIFSSRSISKNKLMVLAELYGAEYYLVKNVNSFNFSWKIKKPAIGLVCGFNQIFKKNPINDFETVLNFHPSLLPLYRGPIPSYWVLKNKEPVSGITVHRLTEQIDDGEIIYNNTVAVSADDTPDELDRKISLKGAKILSDKFDEIVGNRMKKDLVADINGVSPTYYGKNKRLL